AALPHGQRRPGAVEVADPRPRVGVRLGRRRRDRRVLHLLPAAQGGRPRHRRRQARPAHPHPSRRRVPAPRAHRMTLRKHLSAIRMLHRLVLIVAVFLGPGPTVAGATTATLLRGYLLSQTDEQIATAARNINIDTLEQLRVGASTTMPSDYYVRLQFPDGPAFNYAVSWTVQ